MRITSIAVTGLFGTFDHTIPLNREDRITVIYGLNGLGKTFTLLLVTDLFSTAQGMWDRIVDIPFATLAVEFDNGAVLTLVKREEADRATLELTCTDPTCGELHRWEGYPGRDMPLWLARLRDEVSVRFFNTEQLMRPDGIGRTVDEKEALDDVIAFFRARREEYAALASELEKTFPGRLAGYAAKVEPAGLRSRLAGLRAAYDRLKAVGIIDPETVRIPDATAIGTSTDALREATLRAEDAGRALAVFDGVPARLDLLLGTVNRRLSHKHMTLEPNDGFVYTTATGHRLAMTQLSSGEQRLIILLAKMLFTVRADTLVLIDEPELSFHIAWQQEFLLDMAAVIGLVGCDILVATHSPQIIHDRWDLTVELKESRT